MKPYLSYYGGKQKLAHNIINLIPQHTVYVEPFCGGAAIFFMKPWPQVDSSNHYREVINDKDEYLINLYKVLQDKPEELKNKLQYTLYSRSEYIKALDIWRDLSSYSDIDRAWSCFVNVNMSFNNSMGSGWKTGCFSSNHANTWMTKIKHVLDNAERISSVYIECGDAIDIIRKWDSPQTFFYCDPPYPNSSQGHYEGYTLSNFRDLVGALNQCQGSFLLSNYEQDKIQIPKDWECFEFSSYASSFVRVDLDRAIEVKNTNTKTKRTEMIWRRFNRGTVRPEIQKLYNSDAFSCFCKKP